MLKCCEVSQAQMSVWSEGTMNVVSNKHVSAVSLDGNPDSLTRWTAGIAVLLVIAGLVTFSYLLQQLWNTWINDDLRSFGMLIPPTSLCLALYEWKPETWGTRGTWWGLTLIVAALLLGTLMYMSIGLLLFVYFSGVVLLFGGTRAWRATRFPLLLLVFVNPIPHFFGFLVDGPLQAIGARTARAFAHLINVPVTGSALKLMFSSNLGIFIAPGCDGLRGAATMGYMALVVGYIWKLPALRWVTYTVGAVALAYVFNLIRLCAVIGYYWFALRLPVLGQYGTQIDYVIGGLLFTCAAVFLFGIPRLAKRECVQN